MKTDIKTIEAHVRIGKVEVEGGAVDDAVEQALGALEDIIGTASRNDPLARGAIERGEEALATLGRGVP
jgi:hypothetical protein